MEKKNLESMLITIVLCANFKCEGYDHDEHWSTQLVV